MRHQRQVAGTHGAVVVAGIEADGRPHQPQHVRPQHPDAVFAGDGQRFLHHFVRQRVGVAEFLGEQHGLDAFFATLLHDARPRPHGSGDDGQIDRRFDRAHRTDSRHATYDPVVQVDRIQPALEAPRQQVGKDRLPHRAWGFTGADHGNRFGRQQRGKVVRFHDDFPRAAQRHHTMPKVWLFYRLMNTATQPVRACALSTCARQPEQAGTGMSFFC